MSVQNSLNVSTKILIRDGITKYKNGTIAQDAARTTSLLFGTVMAYNVVNQNWVPWNNAAALQGEAIPRGVYVGEDILAATLVAGDVEDCPIVVGGLCELDAELIVYDDDTLTAATVVGVSNGEMLLREIGIYLADTTDNTEYEN